MIFKALNTGDDSNIILVADGGGWVGGAWQGR